MLQVPVEDNSNLERVRIRDAWDNSCRQIEVGSSYHSYYAGNETIVKCLNLVSLAACATPLSTLCWYSLSSFTASRCKVPDYRSLRRHLILVWTFAAWSALHHSKHSCQVHECQNSSRCSLDDLIEPRTWSQNSSALVLSHLSHLVERWYQIWVDADQEKHLETLRDSVHLALSSELHSGWSAQGCVYILI